MEGTNKIILWNDDNHAKKVFVNGCFVGNSDDVETFQKLSDVLELGYEVGYRGVETKEVYIYDLPEEYEDCIINFLQTTDRIPIAHTNAILKENYQLLAKIIKQKFDFC